MWRFESTHERADSQYFDQMIAALEVDAHAQRHADAILDAAAHQEPLIAQSLLTPQDPRFHAEGPLMRDHLRLMLMFLFSLAEEKAHLVDIEELCRLKGYEGEIQELEDLMKENMSFFQVYALCHDAAKPVSVTFSSRRGSRGFELGFNTPRAHHFDEAAYERAQKCAQYRELYRQFAQSEFHGTDRQTQAQFYLHYGIDVHYPGHARKIHAPVYDALLTRLCEAHRLPARDRELLEDLISHHMEFGRDFHAVRPARIARWVHLATKRGYDADDFIDLAQACLFLDHSVGSVRLSAHGIWHETGGIVNFLKSEHDWAPHRRGEKEAARESRDKKRRNQLFREVGLDGMGLMDVLGMEPGPEFGRALRRIQAAVLGQGEMPRFGAKADAEIEKRAGEFYKKMFAHGV